MFKPFEKSGKGCDWEEMGQYHHYSYVPTSVTGDLSTHERIWSIHNEIIRLLNFQSSQQDWINWKYNFLAIF